MKPMLAAILIGAVLMGAVAGGLVLYITWQHNPQCEFHCEGVIHWGAWLPYGAVAALLGFVGGLPISASLATVVAILRARR
jgi:hypothetical protein